MEPQVRPLVSTPSWEEARNLVLTFVAHKKVLFFGNWTRPPELSNAQKNIRSNTQFNAFEFFFRGSTVRWIGSTGPDHGCADVLVDGQIVRSVDTYSEEPAEGQVLFELSDIDGDRAHTLRVVVRKERHPNATDCFQDLDRIESEEPVLPLLELAREMEEEYSSIRLGKRPVLAPEKWQPVALQATFPSGGVTLGPGPLGDAFDRNIAYLNHCSRSPTYCDGVGWSAWLPGSNEGRMLAGAANSLRWGERDDMRSIVNRLTEAIVERARPDGYYNYYDEENSYALTAGLNSERKNYDRFIWTRGLLAAGRIGASGAHDALRGMYDWFNKSPYLNEMLIGANGTAGLPLGPQVYLSPVGKVDDLVTTLRYYDQHYWREHLERADPLAMAYYPGERPHCYALLGFEMLVDLYRATGAREYIDAAKGAWQLYRDNFKHVGSATAIMEHYAPLFPPKSYFIETTTIGEACGSVFWAETNSLLMQLYPEDEVYAAELEEAIYNVILGAQDHRGYLRYNNVLQGKKHEPGCSNSCCECTTVGFIARLPEYVYSLAGDGIYVNLFADSSVTWTRDGVPVTVTLKTRFPYDPGVRITVAAAKPTTMTVRIRVPSWATAAMTLSVNGVATATGSPGSYVAIDRHWSSGDEITFDLPVGFRTVKYEGFEQVPGNLDRVALVYGPLLMALCGDVDVSDLPRIRLEADTLASKLTPVSGSPLSFAINGRTDFVYRPYFAVSDESFVCFPVVDASA